MLSVHTSPLDQPGVGDAGGMNVYVIELARRLADLGTQVEVFTRATSSRQPAVVEAAPGVLVRHVTAGPYQGLAKQDLPAELCSFTAAVLRAEAVQEPGYYDLLHSHYWLSGHVGWLAKQRWGVPLVHTMHTMAKVKNAALADGDAPEPDERVLGEQQVVRYSDRLVANTYDEADQLISLYGADPRAVRVVHPGVDLEVFTPGDQLSARQRLDLPVDAHVLLFAGRIQPLKGPDILVRATAELLARQPELRDRLVVPVVGGPSGGGMGSPQALAEMSRSLGVADVMRFEPPVERGRLADWYRAASLVVVPSHSESFGLVAIEAQACATPVVAADVAGLRTAVLNGRSGVLVPGHDPADYARVLADLLAQPRRREELAQGALHHAREFGWAATAEATLAVYCEALADLSAANGGAANDTVAGMWRPVLRVPLLSAP